MIEISIIIGNQDIIERGKNMWIPITESKELELVSENYGAFSDSFIEKFEFISGMMLTSDGAISYTNKSTLDESEKFEPYENTEITLTIRSQLNPEGIVLRFKDILKFNYDFSSGYDNILNDNIIELSGYRFQFKTDCFSITSKMLEYKII